jgi:hypothetical protein
LASSTRSSSNRRAAATLRGSRETELVLQATTAALMLAPLLRGSVYTLHRSDPVLLGFVLLRFVSRSLAQPANP